MTRPHRRSYPRSASPWSARPVYFGAFVIAAAFLTIGLPLLLTRGR